MLLCMCIIYFVMYDCGLYVGPCAMYYVWCVVPCVMYCGMYNVCCARFHAFMLCVKPCIVVCRMYVVPCAIYCGMLCHVVQC